MRLYLTDERSPSVIQSFSQNVYLGQSGRVTAEIQSPFLCFYCVYIFYVLNFSSQFDVPNQTELLLHRPTYPNYSVCVPCSDTRLRSTTRENFLIPRTHRHLANRARAVAAPSSWNS